MPTSELLLAAVLLYLGYRVARWLLSRLLGLVSFLVPLAVIAALIFTVLL